MLCGFCRLKDKTGQHGCPKSARFIMNRTPACSQFVFNTRKIDSELLRKALLVNRMPKTKIMAFMCLLDSTLRLRAQGLELGLTLPFKMQHGKKREQFEAEAYLISAPKKRDEAYAVAYKDGKLVSITLPKKEFLKALDDKLLKIWDFVESKALLIKSEKKRKRLLKRYVGRMDRKFLQRTFLLRRVPIKSQNKTGIVNELNRLFER